MFCLVSSIVIGVFDWSEGYKNDRNLSISPVAIERSTMNLDNSDLDEPIDAEELSDPDTEDEDVVDYHEDVDDR